MKDIISDFTDLRIIGGSQAEAGGGGVFTRNYESTIISYRAAGALDGTRERLT